MAELQSDQQRLQHQADAERLEIAESLSELAGVLENSAEKPLPARCDDRDALLTSCVWVGSALGVTVKPPDRYPARLEDIACASGFQVRKVVLKTAWWRRDNGPILAYRSENGRPVALLPTSAQRYVLVDPVAGTQTSVTAEIAETLAPAAITFYRPFPVVHHVLTAWEVVKFGVHGLRNDITTMMLMGFLGGILALVVPLATGHLFDAIIPFAERGKLLQLAFALIVSAVAGTLFQLTRSFALLRVQTKMTASVQAAVWARLLQLPVSFFRQYTVGDLSVRANGINSIGQMLSATIVSSVLSGVFSIFAFGLLFYYSIMLALVATGLVLVFVSVTAFSSYFQLRYERRLLDVQGKIAGTVLQLITGISKIRVAGAEARAFARWTRLFSGQRRLALTEQTIRNFLMVFNTIFTTVTTMVIFAIVVLHLQDTAGQRGFSIGEFLAFNAAFGGFQAAMISLSSALISVLAVVPIYERAKPILETTPEVGATKASPGELNGELEINHLSFRYRDDTPFVLNDVSLHVKPGEFVAIVGASGAGKSTLLRLLLGFETLLSGAIYYDGKDLATLDIRQVRRQLGVVLQNAQLMPGDIFTNIIGNAPLTLDDAWEAARIAGLDEDIERMPMGMHTIIGDGASTFSGGQRQRLMIARAVVRKPRLLLFDEATSALDNRTQGIVSKSLERLKATRIVIAHRLSTVKNADRIYVFEEGRVVQCGTYDELIAETGLFADLAKQQIP